MERGLVEDGVVAQDEKQIQQVFCFVVGCPSVSLAHTACRASIRDTA